MNHDDDREDYPPLPLWVIVAAAVLLGLTVLALATA